MCIVCCLAQSLRVVSALHSRVSLSSLLCCVQAFAPGNRRDEDGRGGEEGSRPDLEEALSEYLANIHEESNLKKTPHHYCLLKGQPCLLNCSGRSLCRSWSRPSATVLRGFAAASARHSPSSTPASFASHSLTSYKKDSAPAAFPWCA